MNNLLFSIMLILPNLFYGFILKNKMCYKTFITLNACEIDVFAKDMELTSTLKERVDSKIGKVLNKLGQDAITANVVLRVQQMKSSGKHLSDDNKSTMKSSHISEVTIIFKGGGVLHASERTEDMYASIDLISHKIAKALRKHHERSLQQRKENAFKNDIEPLPEFNEESLLSDLAEKFKTQSKVIHINHSFLYSIYLYLIVYIYYIYYDYI